MEVLRKYGVATTILFPLIDRDNVDFENTPVTFVADDSQIMKDEGAFANTTNLPVHEGNGIYSLALTAAEMQAGRIIVTIIDAATKTWEDQAVAIDTEIPGSIRQGTAQGGAAGSITLDAGASATDGVYQESIVYIVSGTGAEQSRVITDYNGTTKVAGVGQQNWTIIPDATSRFVIMPHNIGVETILGFPLDQFVGITGTDQVGEALQAAIGVRARVVSATASTIIFNTADTDANNSFYDGNHVEIISGTGEGQVRLITSYVGISRVASIDENWITNPDATSIAKIHGRASPRLEDMTAAVKGTADASTTTTFDDAERTEADVDYWADAVVMFTAGPAAYQLRRISAFDPVLDRITVDKAWTQAPGLNDYVILRSAMQKPAGGGMIG